MVKIRVNGRNWKGESIEIDVKSDETNITYTNICTVPDWIKKGNEAKPNCLAVKYSA